MVGPVLRNRFGYLEIAEEVLIEPHALRGGCSTAAAQKEGSKKYVRYRWRFFSYAHRFG